MKFLYGGIFFLAFFCTGLAQERYLKVTSGGGVTGIATQYKISPDGQVLRGKGLGDIKYTEVGKLKKCTVKKQFKKAEKIVTSHPDFNHPGNLYYSIMVFSQGTESQITWGNSEYEVPEDADKLYIKINKVLGRLTFVPDMRK